MQYGIFPLKHFIYKSSVMETNHILHADVLDILFEGRNKMYGAYELRKTYNNRLKAALAVMVSCCLRMNCSTKLRARIRVALTDQ